MLAAANCALFIQHLGGDSMETQELISLLRRSIQEWNKWRESIENDALKRLRMLSTNESFTSEVFAEVRNLVNVNLEGANLQGANLRGANLGSYDRLTQYLRERGFSSGALCELLWDFVHLGKADLSYADLRGADLHRASLINANLQGAELSEANLRDTILDHASLSGDAKFCSADLRGASLRGASFGLPAWVVLNPNFMRDEEEHKAAGFYKPHLDGAILNEVDLCEATFNGLDLRGIDLNKAKRLTKAQFVKSDLSGIDFTGADLREVNFRQANLIETNLTGARLNKVDISRVSHIKALGSISKLTEESLRAADLRGANLHKAILNGVDLSWMNLTGTNLREAELKNANLVGTNLTKKDLQGAKLSGADLSYTMLVETDFTKANLEGCRVYGASVWDVKLEEANQKNLIITSPQEPFIAVDDLETAQFVYLLLKYEKLRSVINAVTRRGVFILGRFGGGGLEILQAIAVKLREMKYLPIIFDFKRPDDRNYTETVKTLVGLSRFVIVDLSGPSVAQELYATVPHFKIPFIPIIEKGRKAYAMHKDILEYPWVLNPPVEFADKEELIELVHSKIVVPAEEKTKERQQLLEQFFKQS